MKNIFTLFLINIVFLSTVAYSAPNDINTAAQSGAAFTTIYYGVTSFRQRLNIMKPPLKIPFLNMNIPHHRKFILPTAIIFGGAAWLRNIWQKI